MIQRPKDRDLLAQVADVLGTLPVLRDELERHRLAGVLPPALVDLRIMASEEGTDTVVQRKSVSP